LRILYLTEFLSSIGGGGEVSFYDLAKAMARRGHQVHVICHKSDQDCESLVKRSSSPNINNLHINRIRPKINLRHGYFPSLFQQLLYLVSLVVNGYKVARENEIDIIHSNTLSPAFAGCIIGIIFHKPTITTIHHVFSARIKNYYFMKMASTDEDKGHDRIKGMTHSIHTLFLLISHLPKLIYEKMIVSLPVDVLHTVSHTSKDDLVNLFNVDKSRIVVIPNGLDLGLLDIDVVEKRAKKTNIEGSIEYEDFVLFVGRLVHSKNVALAIHSMSYVIRELPTAKLVIVGDGPMKIELEEMVSSLHLEDNVKFIGYVTEIRKRELLNKCSALVLPSLVEGFGLVILEAFGQNKPVLVPNVKPFDEIISDEVDGFILPTGDPQEWADKITLLLSNKSASMAMGTKGNDKVKSMFSIDSVAEQFELLYSKHVGNFVKIILAQKA
jgi:glycosyltransferase involved in cell wall biosynthesis